MDQHKLDLALIPWVAAHEKKRRARTSTEAFWATRDIAKAKPAMVEAYAAVAALDKTETITESVEEEDDTTRKRFDYYCVPASPAMQTLVECVWLKWTAYQRMFSRHATPSDKFLLSTCLSNIVNAELSDPSTEGVTISGDKVRLSLLSRYRPQVFNARFLIVVDGLVGCGMLLRSRGSHGMGLCDL